MRRAWLIAVTLLSALGIALSVGAWTQTATAEWLKGIIYAGSSRVQLTDATGNLVVAANSVTLAKLATGPTASVVGVTGTAGNHVDIASSADGDVLRRSGSTLGFGTVATAGIASSAVTTAKIADNAVTFAKLPTGTSAMSVIGVTGATGLNYTPISAGNDGNVLRRSGSTLGFGPVSLSDGTNAVTGTLSIGLGGTSGTTAASGFANLSPLTTKGDLISYSTSPQRVAVGTTGQLLQSDSTAATGISWTSNIFGTTTNNNAPTGYVGEQVRSQVAQASAVTLSTGTPLNITSISLTAGDWDISATCALNGTLTGTEWNCAVSTSTNTLPATTTLGDQWVTTPTMPTATEDIMQTVAAFRVQPTATTTYYWVARSTFSAGTAKAYGRISARRVR